AAAYANLTQTAELKEAVSGADLIIEAVPENLDLKRQVWSQVGELADDNTMFATNTSTLMPSKFADASGAPERFLALHFANHICIYNTAAITQHYVSVTMFIDKAVKFAEENNMVPMPLKREHHGYVLVPLLVPLLTAAMTMTHHEIAEPAANHRDWRNPTG